MEQFIKDKIKEIAFVNVTSDQELWESKILDSITIVELVVEIEDELGIKIPFNEITLDHFSTIEKMLIYIESKK